MASGIAVPAGRARGKGTGKNSARSCSSLTSVKQLMQAGQPADWRRRRYGKRYRSSEVDLAPEPPRGLLSRVGRHGCIPGEIT